jgi:hypothetical protein
MSTSALIAPAAQDEIATLFVGFELSKANLADRLVAAVMQTRSRTFEMPSGLSLPSAFGINTRLIGSGR